MDQPYISIVVTSRNDGHGGNILKRMTLFLKGLMEQTRLYKFPLELIFVEWNPPADRPRLYEVLPKPAKSDYLALKYIAVPERVHNKYRRAGEIPLFQMTAKNVGIRRARGEFILCANIDLLFSKALFENLIKRDLRKDTVYRANRCDVPDEIHPDWPFERQLEWCGKHVIRRHGRDRRFKNANLELFGLNGKNRIKKQLFDIMLFFAKYTWPAEKRKYFQMDTFACGDFTLMHRDIWMAIQGYVELDLYSIHIDSLAIIAAASLGYGQHTFHRKACTFHIDHPMGWERISPLEKLRWQEERPGLGYDLLFDTALFLFKKPAPLNMNRADWGFSEDTFEEIVFGCQV